MRRLIPLLALLGPVAPCLQQLRIPRRRGAGDLNTDYRAWVLRTKVEVTDGVSEIRFGIAYE